MPLYVYVISFFDLRTNKKRVLWESESKMKSTVKENRNIERKKDIVAVAKQKSNIVFGPQNTTIVRENLRQLPSIFCVYPPFLPAANKMEGNGKLFEF